MNSDKKEEYKNYIQMLYDDIERIKLMDVPEEELSKEIDSINKMILRLQELSANFD